MTAPPATRAEVGAQLATLLGAARAEGNGVGVLAIRATDVRRVMLAGGYREADSLLAEAGRRIGGAARAQDYLARIGDHDFVLLLPGVGDPRQAMLAANKVLRAAEGSRGGADSAPLIRLAVGVAAYPEHGAVAEDLLWAAEGAAERAALRGSGAEVADLRPAPAEQQPWRVESLLGRAMERGEFELHYQPKVRLADRALAGFEALSRWLSPELGEVEPALFIALAEKGPHIEQLMWSSVHTGLNQLAEWRAEGFAPALAVNLSPTCLRSADLAERIQSALTLWSIPGPLLTLEVTEGAILPQPERSFATLKELRALGVRISIDDFGTGYSSFAYFRDLPADELKIDRMFISRLLASEPDGHIVQSVIDLAHRLGLAVVAEGIEDGATADRLMRMGCDIGQGYYFGRALTGPAALAVHHGPARRELALLG